MGSNYDELHWRQTNGDVKHLLSCLPKDYSFLACKTSDLRRNYIYPSTLCPQLAFHTPINCSPKSIPSQEFTNSLPRYSPLSCQDTLRTSQLTSKINDNTLLSAASTNDLDQTVSKINLMFPTVSEQHIRQLLKKYFNREALVISALQVEKYPMSTPGPCSTTPPSFSRNFSNIAMGINTPIFRSNSKTTGSPITRPGSGFSQYADSSVYCSTNRHSPLPASTTINNSPRMKLRYVKNQFPDVDETIILDLLYNNDKNVQKVSEDLISMGFKRKTKSVPKIVIKEVIGEEDKIVMFKNKSRLKTNEEKIKIRNELQEQYKSISDHILTIALESVNYNDDRARQILDIMMQEELESKHILEEDEREECNGDDLQILQSKKNTNIETLSEVNKEVKNKQNVLCQSQVDLFINRERVKELGVWRQNNHQSLAKGSDSSLLLKNYEKWIGPDGKNLSKNSSKIAKGPNSLLLTSEMNRSLSLGPNKSLCNGPVYGLAKGSAYSPLRSLLND